jgi:hypothetical protein
VLTFISYRRSAPVVVLVVLAIDMRCVSGCSCGSDPSLSSLENVKTLTKQHSC